MGPARSCNVAPRPRSNVVMQNVTERATLQADVRRAITEADELSRKAHGERLEPLAQAFDGLRTAFARVDEALGGERSVVPVLPDVRRVLDDVAAFSEALGDAVARDARDAQRRAIARFRALVARLSADLDAMAPSRGLQSRPILGLPLARVVPHDVRALADYAVAGACVGSAALARTTSARVAGAALGALAATVAATTDQRLAIAKLVPIESKVVFDPLFGAAAIAAPFVLGYARRDPATAAVHVLAGVATLASALFTDYRAATGVGRGRGPRSKV